ncbi:MAG TPA: hypothetical protein VFE37_08335 [Chloroflexota bacterium]|nr:hypothetical protein [Chloroflexota bacterium]
MTSRWLSRSPIAPVALSALAAVAAFGLAACSAAGPPKPPPPPLDVKDAGSPGPAPTTLARAPGAPSAPPAVAPTAGPTVMPTMPPVVQEAAAAAPPPPGAVDESDLPSGAEMAQGVIAALAKAKTARLSATLPNGHSTDLRYVAPDRAALVETDENGQPYAEYVILSDTGYYKDSRSGGSWVKVGVNEGYKQQAQIFRPIQIALATGQARPLPSGDEVEVIEDNGKPVLHAVYEYGSSQELQDLGLMRSNGNVLDVLVDAATWLPLRSREETETGGPQKSVTEVRFLAFNEPLTVDAPIP